MRRQAPLNAPRGTPLPVTVNYAEIGATLRAAREAKGMTQKDVARRLLHAGVKRTPAALSLLEKGETQTPIAVVDAYAEIVGCRLIVLLSRPGDHRAELLARLADHIPGLDETTIETLGALADLWDSKRGGASARTP